MKGIFLEKENNGFKCCCSSGVEHFLGKEEVSGSNPDISSEVAVNKLAAFLFYYI